ncbi:hypothetical protein IMZ48_16940 [Candidatus Bathyarchaeota archaeon]|nr:hypothetical protein [Candidatus Bathyarchaeota archaeon]
MKSKRPESPSADEAPDKSTDCEKSSVLATPANSAAFLAADLATSVASLTEALAPRLLPWGRCPTHPPRLMVSTGCLDSHYFSF